MAMAPLRPDRSTAPDEGHRESQCGDAADDCEAGTKLHKKLCEFIWVVRYLLIPLSSFFSHVFAAHY